MDDINRSQTVMVRELIITEPRNGHTPRRSERILKATQTRCVLATSFGSLSTHLSQQRDSSCQQLLFFVGVDGS